MALTVADVKKIAHLARLNLSPEEMTLYTAQLDKILDFVAQMSTVDTDAVAPLTNALDLSQRMRPDAITEPNQREAFQAIAPKVEAGLYLVPKVIEDA